MKVGCVDIHQRSHFVAIYRISFDILASSSCSLKCWLKGQNLASKPTRDEEELLERSLACQINVMSLVASKRVVVIRKIVQAKIVSVLAV